MHPKGGAAQDKPAHRDHRQGDDYQPRHRAEVVIADPLEADIGVDHRGAVGQQIGGAAQRRVGAEGDDKRRQPGEGDQRAVEQAEQQAEHQRRRNRQQRKRRDQRHHHRGHCGGAKDGADGKVNAAGEDDEGHSRRQHNVDRGLAGDIQQIAFREKVGGDKAENGDDQDEDRQNADGLHQVAHQHFFRRSGFRDRRGGLFRYAHSCPALR